MSSLTETCPSKERPILFSGPMVRLILDGKKTQTRRAVKSFSHYIEPFNQEMDCIKDKDGEPSRLDCAPDNWECCPYGVPGDRLWVRETYTMAERLMSLVKTPCYRADEGITENNRLADGSWPWKWTPGIHMFRAHSRITLEVTHTSVEPLQEISAEDAWAEGVPYSPDVNPIHEYREIWERINGAGSWIADPWVWVVHFKRVPQ